MTEVFSFFSYKMDQDFCDCFEEQNVVYTSDIIPNQFSQMFQMVRVIVWNLPHVIISDGHYNI